MSCKPSIPPDWLRAASNVGPTAFLRSFPTTGNHSSLCGVSVCFVWAATQLTDDQKVLGMDAVERTAQVSRLERSSHTAFIENNTLFVWGGYQVRSTCTFGGISCYLGDMFLYNRDGKKSYFHEGINVVLACKNEMVDSNSSFGNVGTAWREYAEMISSWCFTIEDTDVCGQHRSFSSLFAFVSIKIFFVCFFFLQEFAGEDITFPTDEIWLYDLDRGSW